jgi:hypothetical protein
VWGFLLWHVADMDHIGSWCRTAILLELGFIFACSRFLNNHSASGQNNPERNRLP